MASANSPLLISEAGQLKEIAVSEIPFMDLEQSFSSPVDLSENSFYLFKDMSDICDVKIVDLPENYYSSEEENEQITLFD